MQQHGAVLAAVEAQTESTQVVLELAEHLLDDPQAFQHVLVAGQLRVLQQLLGGGRAERLLAAQRHPGFGLQLSLVAGSG